MHHAIDPQDIDDAFFEIWRAGGTHLQAMFQSTDARWLRAELPLMREHFSFSLGNNLYFVQVYDVEDDSRHLQYSGRLKMIVEDAHVRDAKAIGCFLPMKQSSDGWFKWVIGKSTWKPATPGWGLIDYETSKPIDPCKLKKDGLVQMGDWEIHDVGVQFVKEYLAENGWEIDHWQSDRHVFPSLVVSKDEEKFAFVVSSSIQPNSEKGHRPESLDMIRSRMRNLGLIPKFIGLGLADGTNDPFDPMLTHLKRRLFRGCRIVSTAIEIEDL